MDTPEVRLAELTAENTEILGLNGRPAGQCGYSLPILRHKPTGLWCVLSTTRKPGPAWSRESEIREMQAAGRITLFPAAIKSVSGWSVESASQPVVVWLSLSPSWGDLIKSQFKQTDLSRLDESGAFVFCADQSDVERWLSDLASAAQTLFDGLLASDSPDWSLLSEYAEVGLQASRKHEQRYWAYVRRSVALYFCPGAPPEQAYQLFRGAVEPHYKGATWVRFFEAMGVIYQRAKYARQELTAASIQLIPGLRWGDYTELTPGFRWGEYNQMTPRLKYTVKPHGIEKLEPFGIEKMPVLADVVSSLKFPTSKK